jgi:hypothetical protein
MPNLGSTNLSFLANLPPTDDPGFRLWKKKREEFENKFADDLKQVDDWRGPG